MARKGFLSMLLLPGLMPSWTIAVMRDEIDVTLNIVDEQGRGIPYATVWGYLLPRKSSLAPDANDLWRVTVRYQSSFEFATPYNRIVPNLLIHPMAGGDGRAALKIDYKYFEGSAAKRPEKMSVGFTVMKRGYLPERIDFAVMSESTLSGKVVLKRDPDNATEAHPYLVSFERLRYELSDPRHNAAMSHQQIERLRTQLEAIARQALDAGDKKAAARIYARMQYLPEVRFIQGKPAGFTPSDPYSEQSWGYLAKAYALDPANPYIAAKYLYRQGSQRFGGRKYDPEKASQQQKRAFKEYLGSLHTLMRAQGEHIWPTYHELYAVWHQQSSNSNERERVKPLLEALYRAEPTFKTRETLLQIP